MQSIGEKFYTILKFLDYYLCLGQDYDWCNTIGAKFNPILQAINNQLILLSTNIKATISVIWTLLPVFYLHQNTRHHLKYFKIIWKYHIILVNVRVNRQLNEDNGENRTPLTIGLTIQSRGMQLMVVALDSGLLILDIECWWWYAKWLCQELIKFIELQVKKHCNSDARLWSLVPSIWLWKSRILWKL